MAGTVEETPKVKRQKRQDTATYTVQVFEAPEVGHDSGVWVDVATVTVPSGSKRRSVIEDALEQGKRTPKPGDKPLLVRVLDAGSAHIEQVVSEQPPPQIRIGE